MKDALLGASFGRRLLRIRLVFWNLVDQAFFKKPRWHHYLALNNEPYSATFASPVKRQKIEDGITNFAPETLHDGARVLDLGCGDGYGFSVLKTRFGEKVNVVGLTINRAEMKAVRRQGLRAKRGDMHAMPFANNQFDFIFCQDTLEHSISPYIAVSEVNRVLKIGAKAVISIPSDHDQTDVW